MSSFISFAAFFIFSTSLEQIANLTPSFANSIAEAFPRDVQIENMSSKVKDLERELKKKEQESRMQKVGGEFYNITFALGRQSGFTIVGSMGSTVMQFESVAPPISEDQGDLGDLIGGFDFGDIFGIFFVNCEKSIEKINYF